MIRIPSENKRHAVSGVSDFFGTIHYTRNINLDEDGYIKLSSRAVALLSEQDDADAELANAFGKSGSGGGTITVYVLTSGKAWTLSFAETSLSVTKDSDSPAFTSDSHGKWFHNFWVTTEDIDFNTGSGAAYTDRGNNTTGKMHPIEVFRNRNTICFGDGNTVKQYSESGGTFTADTTLTIPIDFEVIGLAYANNRMGVLTIINPDTLTGQNQEAFFFVWDGANTTAEQGIPIGSDFGLGVVAYKGSWVVLTRTGQLLFATGGGFQQLAAFPFYHLNLDMAIPNPAYPADILTVEGDVIYINFQGLLQSAGLRYEQYAPQNPGGVWCYDPQVGLYHRSSPSISMANLLTITSGNVDTATNIMTKTAGTVPTTGSPIKYLSSKATLIGGLTTPNIYYCIKVSATEFKLATTKALADAGTAIDITGTGAANNYFLAVEQIDYGQAYIKRSGALALTDARSNQLDHMLMSAEMSDDDSTSQYEMVCATMSGFENRGYFVTAKIPSLQVTDKGQKVFVKYRPLATGDSIHIKVKDKDIVGLPVLTAQARNSNINKATWTDSDTFTTTVDLDAALDAYDDGVELECEIIGGLGAGTLVKVSSITFSDPTYTVNLAESVQGAASGKLSDVVIENWRSLGSITSDDTDGVKAFNVDTASPWVKFKVELRGSETTVEEVLLVAETHQAAQ